MNCRDCLHYEACRDVYDELAYKNKTYDFEFDEEDYARIGCHNFTDRSEWAHLPCAEGTKVYKVCNNTYACYDCEGYDAFNDCCEYRDVDCPLIAKSPVCSRHYLEVVTGDADKDFILHHINDFGKTIFLTCEEAEKALNLGGKK